METPEPVVEPEVVVESEKMLTVLHFSKKNNKFPITSTKTFLINYDPTEMILSENSTFRVGNKWENILWYLENNANWKQYEYVWFPDETLEISENEIVTFKNIVKENKLVISQPSLKMNKNVHHKVLVNVKNKKLRKSPFVQNQLPCFERSFIEQHLLPFLKDNRNMLTSGWGIDLWWSQKHTRSLYIVDAIQVSNSSINNTTKGKIEMTNITKKYKLRSKV